MLGCGDLYKSSADLHAVALGHVHNNDLARNARAQLVQHLHRFDDDQHVVLLNGVARLNANVDDHARKGRRKDPLALFEGRGALIPAAAASAHGLDLVVCSANLQVEAARLFFDQHLQDSTVQDQHVARRFAQTLDAYIPPGTIDVDTQSRRRFLQLSFDLTFAEPQEVLRQGPPPGR